jgi:hypothetical protein
MPSLFSFVMAFCRHCERFVRDYVLLLHVCRIAHHAMHTIGKREYALGQLVASGKTWRRCLYLSQPPFTMSVRRAAGYPSSPGSVASLGPSAVLQRSARSPSPHAHPLHTAD